MNNDTRIETERFYDIVRLAFAKFLDSDKGEEAQATLLKVLNKIEAEFKKFGGKKQTKDKTLWLRFFAGDTLATDIWDIQRTINPHVATHSNYNHMLECMGIAIMPESGMELHFS